MASWQENYKSKVISLEEALGKIKDEDQVITGLGGSEARYILRNIHTIADRVMNVTVVNCLPMENYEFFMNPLYSKKFFNETWFLNGGQRKVYSHGGVSFIPNHLHLAISKRLFHRKCNVFVGVATPPDKHGYISLSLGVTYERECLANADLVILEINDQLPRTFGDTIIKIDDVDFFVEHSEAPPILPNAEPGEKDKIIGKYIAELVEDGATIQLGIGGIPNAVGIALTHKGVLGFHSQYFVDGVIYLDDVAEMTDNKKR